MGLEFFEQPRKKSFSTESARSGQPSLHLNSPLEVIKTTCCAASAGGLVFHLDGWWRSHRHSLVNDTDASSALFGGGGYGHHNQSHTCDFHFCQHHRLCWTGYCAELPDQTDPFNRRGSAGGPADISARAMANELALQVGQQIVVDNRPSAGGIIGWELLARSAPDGYVIGYISTASRPIPLCIQASLRYPQRLYAHRSFRIERQHPYGQSVAANSFCEGIDRTGAGKTWGALFGSVIGVPDILLWNCLKA
jgi:hypothetical protein